MKIDLTDKTFLVTGGNRGIGKAIVARLLNSNAKVAFTYNNNLEEAEKVEQEFAAHKDRLFKIKADLCDFEKATALIEEIESEFSPINGLVNNAGITIDKPFFQMDQNSWEKVVDTNLNGTFCVTKALLPKLIRRDGGKVVNMASVSGLRASAGQANYSATKAALISLTKTLALEFARFNVQVNAVAPGFIETDMVRNMDPKVFKNISNMVPMKRMGATEEVADATLFLLSPNSNYITGHTLVIDGGLTA